MRPTISLRHALSDPALLGSALPGDSWQAWRVLLFAVVGEVLNDDERVLFTELTERKCEPGQRAEEFNAIVGRRGGKSRASAALATYIAGLCDHSDKLAPGEIGIVLCIAPDQRQASIVLEYAAACFEASPLLRQLIASKTVDALTLTNGIRLEVRAASFRRLRGPTYLAVIADEAAFWFSEADGANTDVEILTAVRPGLATTAGLLAIISSPYARRGVLWEAYRRHFGAAGDPLILVARGTSRQLNPTLPQSVVDRALERDHAAASAEYLATFRVDIEGFVALEAIEACISPGCRERPPSLNTVYSGFCDPSGGAADSMVLAIGHCEGSVAVLDCIREVRPPFSPEAVCEEFAHVCRAYRIARICGDKYGGEWVAEQFRKFHIGYEAAAKAKSDIYRDFLPLVNSRRVDLLDHPRLINQLVSLERRTARSGKDSIDHAPGAHDDTANSVAGCLTGIVGKGAYDITALTQGMGELVGIMTGSLPAPPDRIGRRSIWSHPMVDRAAP